MSIKLLNTTKQATKYDETYTSILVKCMEKCCKGYTYVLREVCLGFNFLLKISTMNIYFLCYKNKGFHQKADCEVDTRTCVVGILLIRL